jgi:hypothetical protein
MGLHRAGVMRDGMACLGIIPTTPHGKAVLHFGLNKDLLERVGNVESVVGWDRRTL